MANIQQYKNEFNKNNYFTVSLRIPKEKREVLQMLKETKHKSVNQLIIEAIEKQYNVDLTIVESKLKGDE